MSRVRIEILGTPGHKDYAVSIDWTIVREFDTYQDAKEFATHAKHAVLLHPARAVLHD